MQSRPDRALSEITATMMIVLMVVLLAAVIMVLLSGFPLTPKKPVLAAFSADVVMGANTDATHALNVPTIRLYQMAGDSLSQDYTQGIHSGINGTKMKIISPAGTMYTIVSAISLTGKKVKPGSPYYIFHYTVGEPNEYWLTNDPSRIFPASSGGVMPFSPHGTWRLVITDEKDTNTVLYQEDLVL